MAEADPEHWVLIDATLDKDTVAANIRAAVLDRLGL